MAIILYFIKEEDVEPKLKEFLCKDITLNGQRYLVLELDFDVATNTPILEDVEISKEDLKKLIEKEENNLIIW